MSLLNFCRLLNLSGLHHERSSMDVAFLINSKIDKIFGDTPFYGQTEKLTFRMTKVKCRYAN